MNRLLPLCFCLLATLGHAAPTPLQTVVDSTLAHEDAQQKLLQSMSYDQTANVDQLDSDGKVMRHEVLQMVISPGANPPMKIVSVKGDKIRTNPDEADTQAKGRDVEDNKQTFTLRTLVDRFTIALEKEEAIGGVPAYVISFTPKPNQPYHDETEKVVNQLQGHIWISKQTFSVLQTKATLSHPVSIAWFVASIPKLDFQYTAPDRATGFTTCQVQITLQVNAPFVGFHERQVIDMSNFRPRPMPAPTPPVVPGTPAPAK